MFAARTLKEIKLIKDVTCFHTMHCRLTTMKGCVRKSSISKLKTKEKVLKTINIDNIVQSINHSNHRQSKEWTGNAT